MPLLIREVQIFDLRLFLEKPYRFDFLSFSIISIHSSHFRRFGIFLFLLLFFEPWLFPHSLWLSAPFPKLYSSGPVWFNVTSCWIRLFQFSVLAYRKPFSVFLLFALLPCLPLSQAKRFYCEVSKHFTLLPTWLFSLGSTNHKYRQPC